MIRFSTYYQLHHVCVSIYILLYHVYNTDAVTKSQLTV